MSDDESPKPKKPFLRKGQGKLISNQVKEKKPFLKKGDGKLACFANESQKFLKKERIIFYLKKAKLKLK